jgi:hypothetical protein
MYCLYQGQLIDVTCLLKPVELAQARRDAERVMGLRPAFGYFGQPYEERNQFLTPPPPGDPVRQGAERILAIPEGATAAWVFFGGKCFIAQVEIVEVSP